MSSWIQILPKVLLCFPQCNSVEFTLASHGCKILTSTLSPYTYSCSYPKKQRNIFPKYEWTNVGHTTSLSTTRVRAMPCADCRNNLTMGLVFPQSFEKGHPDKIRVLLGRKEEKWMLWQLTFSTDIFSSIYNSTCRKHVERSILAKNICELNQTMN